jgi:hypothetical protein
MTGFLHRLAARAAGQARSVRSAARLPYMAPPALTMPAAEIGLPEPSLDRSLGEMLRRNAVQDSIPRRHEPGSSAFDVERPLREAPPPDAPIVALRPAIAFDPEQSALQRDETDARSVLRPGPTPQNNKSGDVDVLGAQEIYGSSPVVHFTEPLLPMPRFAPRDGTDTRIAERRISGRQAASAEATEVHVSIGRIEVIAVHEAPRPRPPQRGPVKPMSLEEYLARRRGGRA